MTNNEKYFVIVNYGYGNRGFEEFDTKEEAVEYAQSTYSLDPIFIKGKRVKLTLEES